MNFNLMKHHGFSLSELEGMMPFERDIYVLLLTQFLQEEAKRRQREAMNG